MECATHPFIHFATRQSSPATAGHRTMRDARPRIRLAGKIAFVRNTDDVVHQTECSCDLSRSRQKRNDAVHFPVYQYSCQNSTSILAVACGAKCFLKLLGNWNPFMLLKPRQVFAKSLCAFWRDSLHSQSLRDILHGRIKIAGLSVSRRKRIDHIFVFPPHNAASSLCVLHCLLPIAKG